jgi:hypothetical protein
VRFSPPRVVYSFLAFWVLFAFLSKGSFQFLLVMLSKAILLLFVILKLQRNQNKCSLPCFRPAWHGSSILALIEDMTSEATVKLLKGLIPKSFRGRLRNEHISPIWWLFGNGSKNGGDCSRVHNGRSALISCSLALLFSFFVPLESCDQFCSPSGTEVFLGALKA